MLTVKEEMTSSGGTSVRRVMTNGEVAAGQPHREPGEMDFAELHVGFERPAQRRRDPVAQPGLELPQRHRDADAGQYEHDADDECRGAHAAAGEPHGLTAWSPT